MNFDLNDDQLALQGAVDDFLTKALDQTRLMSIFDSDSGFDPSFQQTLNEVGVSGIMIPEAFGGSGLGMLETAVVAEALGRHAAPGPFLGHVLAALAIAEGGTESQKEQWLPSLASGEKIATVALAEADDCWQPEQWSLKAEGSFVHGQKRSVLFPMQSDVFVVGVADGGLMLIARDEQTQEIATRPCLDATRRVASLTFKGSSAEALDCSGELLRDAGLVLLAADAFGGASRCLEMAVEYAMTREQFGTVIAKFQSLKHQLADMAVAIEPARGLYWYAAHAFDAVPEELAQMAAIAKAHVSERFLEVARAATEVHGGIGYTWEFPLHVWLKRAVFDRMYLGSPSVHRRRSAALSGWAA